MASILNSMDLYNITIIGCDKKSSDKTQDINNKRLSPLKVQSVSEEKSAIFGEEKSRKPLKILILAYPRTGSSLLGEVISAPENMTYFFEPLHTRKIRYNILPIRNIAPLKQYIFEYVSGMFKCKDSALRYFYEDKFIITRSHSYEHCSSQSDVVIKTIRLTGEHVEKLIKTVSKEGGALKIIHLVRDPRAVLASMSRNYKAWGMLWRYGNNGTILCANMIHNNKRIAEMLSIGILNKDNFFEINYDDRMENLWGHIVRLYSFLGIQLSESTVEKIQSHFSDEKVRRSYLSTFQGTEHNKDRWMQELSESEKTHIESKCGPLIKKKKMFSEATIDYQEGRRIWRIIFLQ